MTREEAIGTMNYLKHYAETDIKERDVLEEKDRTRFIEALDTAIKALENIGHLTDRPCDVCEFHGENGCSQWTCVFADRLFGGMNE